MSTLTWPLRLDTHTGQLAAVEQDTDADVVSCVVGILSTPHNWRTDLPDFGRPRQTLFNEGGVDTQDLADAVTTWEPRATPDIVADEIDFLSQTVTVDPGAQTDG